LPVGLAFLYAAKRLGAGDYLPFSKDDPPASRLSFRRRPESSQAYRAKRFESGFECFARRIQTGFRPAPEWR